MATTVKDREQLMEKYRVLLELWHSEKNIGRQEFLGLIIAISLLILVSIGGAWWVMIIGIIMSAVWMVVVARAQARQDYYYTELEAIREQDDDNTLFKSHLVENVEIKAPLLNKPASWMQSASKYLVTGTPVVVVVVWFIGFLIQAVT